MKSLRVPSAAGRSRALVTGRFRLAQVVTALIVAILLSGCGAASTTQTGILAGSLKTAGAVRPASALAGQPLAGRIVPRSKTGTVVRINVYTAAGSW